MQRYWSSLLRYCPQDCFCWLPIFVDIQLLHPSASPRARWTSIDNPNQPVRIIITIMITSFAPWKSRPVLCPVVTPVSKECEFGPRRSLCWRQINKHPRHKNDTNNNNNNDHVICSLLSSPRSLPSFRAWTEQSSGPRRPLCSRQNTKNKKNEPTTYTTRTVVSHVTRFLVIASLSEPWFSASIDRARSGPRRPLC